MVGGPATGKARPPTVDSFTDGTSRDRVFPKIGYFPLELCLKLRTYTISPRQVDRFSTKFVDVDGRAC